MATASEIKVIEAYIGLLGRAPDPAGLAYWAEQLDAAGGTTDAMKKLTNDITLNAEWTTGTQGSLIAADGSITLVNAKALVVDIYENLFERETVPAVSETDQTYWAEQLVDGSVTASEMTVLLIAAAQESGNADAQTLGFKLEAATYYVEGIDQADFSRGTATTSVQGVDGPNSLAASKAVTDILISGEGVTTTLSATVTAATLTAGSDVVNGTVGSDATYVGAALSDPASTDNDTLNLTGDASSITMGTVSQIETINLNLAKSKVAGIDIDADAVSGANTINLTTAATVDVIGVTVTGETEVDFDDLSAANLTTTGVTELSLTSLDAAASQTVTADASLATMDIATVDSNDTNLIFANNDVTLSVTGSANTNDVISVTADNEVALTFVADVENVTLASSNNDLEVTVAGVTTEANITYTVAGSNDVELIGDTNQFAASSFVNSGTGDVGLSLTAATVAADLRGFGVLGNGIELTGTDAFDIEVASGNTVTVKEDTGAALSLDANDTANDSAVTLVLDNDVVNITLVDYETAAIQTGTNAASTGDLSLGGAATTLGGDNDVSTGTITAAGSLNIVADDIVIGAVSGAGDNAVGSLSLIATNDATTVAAAVSNDITVTAGGDVILGSGAGQTDIADGTLKATGDSVTVSGVIDMDDGSVELTSTGNDVVVSAIIDANDEGGSLTITSADDVSITAAPTVEGDITIVATNDVAATATITSDGNDISITGLQIDLTALTANDAAATNSGSIVLNATNDVTDVSTISGLVDADNLTLTNGDFDFTNVTTNITLTDTLAIQGDTDFAAAGEVVANTVVLATTNDVTFADTLVADIIVGGAGGNYELGTVSNNDASPIQITTNAGNDGATLGLAGGTDSVYTVATGDGQDDIVITDIAATSVINTGNDADTILVSATQTTAVVLAGGAGDDTITLAETASASIDGGDGEDTLVAAEAGAQNLGSVVATNIEILQIDNAGGITVSQAFLSNDSDYKITGVDSSITATNVSSANLTSISYGVGIDTGYNLTAAATGSTIVGSDAIDILVGGAGIDNLTGGASADVLTGNAGADVLTGGAGSDDFVLANIANVKATSDRVTDMATGEDINIAATAGGEFGDLHLGDGSPFDGATAGDVGAVNIAGGAADLPEATDNVIAINANTGDLTVGYATIAALQTAVDGAAITENGGGTFADGDELLIIWYNTTDESYEAGIITIAGGNGFDGADETYEKLLEIDVVGGLTLAQAAANIDYIA